MGISASDGGWQKKSPADWDESDTIDWLFEVARKRDDIPSEIILSGRYNSLTGLINFALSSLILVCLLLPPPPFILIIVRFLIMMVALVLLGPF